MRLHRYNLLILLVFLPGFVHASDLKPQYYLNLFGAPKYAANFTHFDYADPKAPRGGVVKLESRESFDNVNPFILKGVKAPGALTVFDSLMAQALDEPETQYGLIAKSVVHDPQNRFVEFTLRKEARFHDGSPIAPDDVVFSFATLRDQGDPIYKVIYGPIAKVEKTGPDSVRFTFADPTNRELPIIAGGMPILSKAYYSTHTFNQTTLEPPLGSGAYRIKSVDQGRSIVYERVKDYWAQDLPVNKGGNNFDEIRYDIYRDETVALEAFKAGNYDFREEMLARNWASAYDFPALKDGRVVKRVIPNEVPQGMQCFVFNARRAKFADYRVREALDLALDFEWMNKTVFGGAYVRNRSFFGNTQFEAKGLPSKAELALLGPYRKDLPPELFTQEYKEPATDGSGNNRDNLLKAGALLDAAGWVVKEGKRVNAKTGEKLTIEFMLVQPSMERIVAPLRKSLERLGIDAGIRIVDDSQYQKRLDGKDFDVISQWFNRNVFYPGFEQKSLWHSSQADIPGSINYSGAKSPVVDALVEKIVTAKGLPELTAAARALDRVLSFEHYVIPHWRFQGYRVAYWNKFGMPKVDPKYALGFGYWWVKPAK